MSFKLLLLNIFFFLIVISLCEDNVVIETPSNDNKNNDNSPSNEQSGFTPEQEADRLEFDHFAKKLMDEMDINKEKEINKDKFRSFLHRLITRDEKLEANEQELYNELIERIVKTAPETIEVSTLPKYIGQDILVNSLNQLIRERYGEEALQQFNQEFNPDL